MRIFRSNFNALIALTLFLSSCSSEKKAEAVYDLRSYNESVSEGVVLVDFYATWCGPCKMMEPHIKSLKDEYGNKLKVVKIDIDKNLEIATHFNISSIPLVKVYSNGKEVYGKLGYHSEEELKTILANYF